jgi:probable HAF family extracellular repeat protein
MRGWLKFIITVGMSGILLLAAGGSASVAAATPPTTGHTIIDLGPGAASGINNRVQIVGTTRSGLAWPNAFLWQEGTGMQDLGSLGGDGETSATSINERGQIVGHSATASSVWHAFLWQAETGMQDLGTLGGLHSFASDINDQGQVVGYSYPPAGESRAFLWQAQTGMRDLGTLSGRETTAYSINERGQVVGYSIASNGYRHAVLWQQGSGMQDLSTLGYLESVATGINARGQVVGYSHTAVGDNHAFLWQADRGMQDLGTLGGPTSFAHDINDRGQVVGFSFDGANQIHPFLWEAGTGMQELGALVAGQESNALRINNGGQIVGYGFTGPDRSAAVLWQDATPPAITPEVSGLQGTNGWYRSDVTVSWSVTDPESGVASSSTCATTTLTRDTSGTTLTCSATNGVGLSDSQSVTVKLDKISPVTTASLTGLPGNNGWYRGSVTLTLAATDNLSGVSSTSYSTDTGATWLTYNPTSPPVFTNDGQYIVHFRSTDKAGNIEIPAKTVSIKLDQTPPVVACAASPTMLWPPNHQLVPVATTVTVNDALAGPAGFMLTSVTSNEPDTRAAGDAANDIQGWVPGFPSTTGQLRAERSGSGTGRVYTLTYTGADQAGNAAACEAVVTVPHDKSP